MELFLMLGIFIIVTIVLTLMYNVYDTKCKFVEYRKNKLIKEYHYQRYTQKDLLHANFIGALIDTLNSKNTLKEKIKFLENL